ncbi:hypothetical protein Lalb_Chr21g0318271 [Lupinus albus]|uniref:Uncharacterized protein n=1 Tax=Lupinus albus TaxID=3870 RepID=A0A6A4NN56_LUPAL|nr:hypothetical protein Lalb_Chr21g0318271 [Lupinus albus]
MGLFISPLSMCFWVDRFLFHGKMLALASLVLHVTSFELCPNPQWLRNGDEFLLRFHFKIN